MRHRSGSVEMTWSRRLTLAVLVLTTTVALVLHGSPAKSASASSVRANEPTVRFGISAPELLADSSAQQLTALQAMHGIGLRWVRVDASWASVQAGGPSSYDWSTLDRLVRNARMSGVDVDLIIDGTPAWARVSAASTSAWAQPSSPAAFATFAGRVASRYRERGVRTYEIWNEPNLQQFFEPAPAPRVYASMLEQAYVAIKAVQPGSTVISGGLAPIRSNGIDINPVAYLRDIYRYGVRQSLDAVGDHAYSYPALPDTYEPWSGWSEMAQTHASIRGVMSAFGDGDKQIWITEIGAPTSGPRAVSLTAQASEVTQTVDNARKLKWVGAVFFYSYQDSSVVKGFGLLRSDGIPKPAWTALASAIR